MSSGRNLFAVTAASFIGFMGFTLVMPFLPLYFHALGVDDVGRLAMWSGLSLGVTPAVTALLSPLWGRLADRFGRKIMVERSLVSFVVIMGAMAAATKPWHVFALRVVQGIFAGYGALSVAMAADSAPEGGMSQAIGTVQTAQRLGPALGPVFGGSIAALVGLRRAFLIAAACYGIALVLVFFLYDERITRAHARDDADGAASVTFRNVIAFENFLLMALVIFAFQFVDRSFGPVLPLFVGALGIPAARIAFLSGLLFSIAAGVGARSSSVRDPAAAHTALQLVVAASAIGRGQIVGYLAAPGIRGCSRPACSDSRSVSAPAAYCRRGMIPASVRGLGFGDDDGVARRDGGQSDPVRGCSSRVDDPRRVRGWTRRAVALALAVHHLGKGDGAKTPSPEPVPDSL